MKITNIELCFLCEDGTTVNVDAIGHDGITEEIFNVQTLDGKYRSDLGCWVTTESSGGDINSSDYPEFDISEIIFQAEQFIQKNTTEERTDYEIDNERVYLIITSDKVNIVTSNSNFINPQQSSYQREYSDPLVTFDTRQEALEYLDNLE